MIEPTWLEIMGLLFIALWVIFIISIIWDDKKIIWKKIKIPYLSRLLEIKEKQVGYELEKLMHLRGLRQCIKFTNIRLCQIEAQIILLGEKK